MSDNSSKTPVIDGYPDVLRRLMNITPSDYFKIIDSPMFPYKETQIVSEQDRLFGIYQQRKRPSWLSNLPAVDSRATSLILYLFSRYNSLYENPTGPVKLSDCLFRTCIFTSSHGISLANRVKEAIQENFRWFYFILNADQQQDSRKWFVWNQTKDQSVWLEELINLIQEEAFSNNSLPVIIRFTLERTEGLDDALQSLQISLIERFQGSVIVSPGNHQTANIEELKFKVGL